MKKKDYILSLFFPDNCFCHLQTPVLGLSAFFLSLIKHAIAEDKNIVMGSFELT